MSLKLVNILEIINFQSLNAVVFTTKIKSWSVWNYVEKIAYVEKINLIVFYFYNTLTYAF